MQGISKHEKVYDLKLIIYFSVVMFLYVFSVQYHYIGQIIGCIAFCICAVYLANGRVEKAFLHYILNLTFSIESVFFATGKTNGVIVYSFIVLPFISTYGVFALNLLLFICIHLRKTNGRLTFYVNEYDSSTNYVVNICKYMLIVGFVMLVYTFIVNDNDIANQTWYIVSVKSELFRMMMLVLTLMNTISAVKRYSGFEYILSRWLVAMLSALSIVAFIAEILGLHGFRMGLTNVSALPLFAFFGIGLISQFKFAKRYSEKIVTILFSASLLILMIIKSTPLGGKWFFAVVITMLFMMYSYTDSFKGVLVIIGIFVMFGIFMETNVIENIFRDNDYMLRKYDEFKSLFQFASNLSQSDDSIAFRLDEIENIWIEICKNPIYFLFGKGIVGTTLHHTNIYSWSTFGTFSEIQSNSGIFFQMHESIAVIILKYGIIGIAGFVYLMIRVLRSVRVSRWGTIGFIWLVFYVGGYISLLFGAVCLVLAMRDLGINTRKYISCSQWCSRV